MGREALKFGTIGALVRRRYSLEIYCEHRGCGHHAAVDLEAIQAEHGEDFPVAAFVARTRCSLSGARHPEVVIRISPISIIYLLAAPLPDILKST